MVRTQENRRQEGEERAGAVIGWEVGEIRGK